MKLLRLCFFIVIGIALTFTLAANGQQESESEKNMRYAHVGVEGAPQTRFAVEFAQLVEERTDGRIKFTLFPNSQLGNVSEMIEGVRGGSIAIAHHDFASLSGIVPKLSVFSAPYVFRDPEHAVRASNPSTSPVLRELNE